jgi:hypothetical protein
VAQAGDVLEMKIVFGRTRGRDERRVGRVRGRPPRGFVVQGRVHPGREERQEVIVGADGFDRCSGRSSASITTR